MKHPITNQKQIRREFWELHPELPRRRIRDYTGKNLMHRADTRCAFVDFVDYLERDGQISADLANRATL